MKKEFIILGAYENANPVDIFLEHVTNLVYVKTTGAKTTLGDLQKAMNEKFDCDELALAAVKDFIDFQMEDGGATLDSVIMADDADDAVTVWHFDLRTNK